MSVENYFCITSYILPVFVMYRTKNYSTPESATPHYRSFAYYRLMRQDHAEVEDLLKRIYASTIGSSSFDEHKPKIYKNSFEELRGTLNKGFYSKWYVDNNRDTTYNLDNIS